MATVENFILRIKTDGADNIKKLSADVSQATDRLNGLAAAIPLAAIGAFAVSAVRMAESLQDLSDATGISVEKIAAFGAALQDAGGKASNAERIITSFFNTIEAAADGSLKLQEAFKKVGVSLDDLRNLSEADLLDKTVKGLAAMEAGSERTRLATTLLSRAFRSVDPAAFAEALRTGDFTKYAESAKASADAIGNMEKSIRELQFAAAEALTPLLKEIGKIKLTAEDVNNGIKIVGITLGLAFGASMLKMITAVNAALGITAGLSVVIGKGPLGIIARLAAVGGTAASIGGDIEVLTKRNDELAESAAKAADALAFPTIPTTPGKAGRTVIEAISEEEKARRESEKRITTFKIESNKNAAITNYENAIAQALKTADEITAIELKTAQEIANINYELFANIDKAQKEIEANDKLNPTQRAAEIAAKEKELRTKAALDIAKARNKLEDEVAKKQLDNYLKIQKSLEEFNDEQEQGALKAIDDQQKQSALASEQIRKYREANQLAADRLQFEDSLRNLTENERARRQDLFEIDQRRLQRIKEINAIEGQDQNLKQQRIDDINKLAEAETKAAVARRELLIKEQEDFSLGWETAWERYAENARRANDQARSYVDIFTRGFEDSFVRLVQTGKLSFKDLANSLIAEFARAQARSILGNLFSIITGGMTIDPSGIGITAGDSPFSATAADIFGRRAGGGPVSRGRGYMVGENGPELFIPASSGNIMNNRDTMNIGGVGTNITYNIQAVDAQSFRSLVARDPQFIYQVTEAGRRSQPTRRLA